MRIPRAVVALLGLVVAVTAAESAAEEAGVAWVPEFGNHWLWVPDRLLEQIGRAHV